MTRALAEALGEQALVICHDRYYRDISNPVGFNYDHPDALETSLLVRHLESLRKGHAAELPQYEYRNHRRLQETEHVAPCPIVIVEGILVLADSRLRECFDLTAFVRAPADIRLMRRIRRDLQKRGQTVEGVLMQYEATVRPMHEAYVAPSERHAEMVLSGTEPLGESVETLLGVLEDRGWRV